jgi:hypothetical protein
MAASYIYSLTAADVAAEIPGVDDANIGASTEPVSTTDLTNWINDGAARFNSALDKAGITASASMDADAHQMVAAGVKAYAAHKAMLILGMGDTASAVAAEREWLAIYAEVSNRPQQLGDEYDDGLTTSIDSLSTFNSTSRTDTIDSDVPVDEWMG